MDHCSVADSEDPKVTKQLRKGPGWESERRMGWIERQERTGQTSTSAGEREREQRSESRSERVSVHG